MKALVKYAPGAGHVELREVEEPRCAENQAKVEVEWCGVCGTDLHVMDDTFRNHPPVILGHEIAGTVVEVGRNIRRISVGDRVSVLGAFTVTCGRCVYCCQGDLMFCPERRGMGHGVKGGFTRYVVAREDQLFRLPENLGLEEGAMCEPFVAAVHAVNEITELHLGDVALVSGPGPIGLMCLKLLAAQGIKTIVAGRGADYLRLEKARQMGAGVVVNVSEQALLSLVKQETDGFGVNVAFECAGAAASARNCLDALRPLGRYTQVGHFGQDVTVPLDRVGFKRLRLYGSVGYTAETWDRTLKILGQGTVQLCDLLTHKLPLAEWKKGFDLCHSKEALKVLLTPGDLSVTVGRQTTWAADRPLACR